jgi:hypothetical protein
MIIDGFWHLIELSVVALVIGLANIGLLLVLMYSYWKTYEEVKSDFTVGLIIFSMLLLFQNVISVIFAALQFTMPGPPPGSEINHPRLPLTLINTVQLIALIILFKLTRR